MLKFLIKHKFNLLTILYSAITVGIIYLIDLFFSQNPSGIEIAVLILVGIILGIFLILIPNQKV